MSEAYSRIVWSLENLPEPAMFRTALHRVVEQQMPVVQTVVRFRELNRAAPVLEQQCRRNRLALGPSGRTRDVVVFMAEILSSLGVRRVR